MSDAGNRAVRERAAARPTVKQHLAAIRMLFDWLIVGQVLAINPAHAVRGPKHVVKRGKTRVLTEEQARRLLESIKIVRKVTLPDGQLMAIVSRRRGAGTSSRPRRLGKRARRCRNLAASCNVPPN